MPLLDIAIAQFSFHNYPRYSRVQLFVHGQLPNCCLLQQELRWPSFQKSFQNTQYFLNFGRINKNSHHKLLVKAVATIEPKCSVQDKDEKKETKVLSSNVELLSSSLDSTVNGDSEEIDERERLRRIRISKANKGNTPWNKGRKHSPETLQRIKERTKLAMQDPKVKMKLANIGHAQSRETRQKIAVGVRLGWKRRRARLQIQETCLYDWQNLIAEAARKGFQHEEELHWDSYKIINEQLQREWLASIEHRKAKPRTRGNKRAPKSPEQRRKIAEAIAAKWADPDYRSRVSTGLAKYYGSPEGAEKTVRRKPRDGSQSPRTPKKKASDAERSAATETKFRNQQTKLKKKTTPKYKDPLANSKLQMLKKIRAQRVASEERKNEALERAKLLIVEAEKATKALEDAATRSPVARASLIEARKLIAEATQSIESIENAGPSEDDLTSVQQYRVKKDVNLLTDDDADQEHHIGVNGTDIGFNQTTKAQNPDDGVYKMPTIKEMDINIQHQSQFGGCEFSKLDIGSFIGKSELRDVIDQQHSPELNGGVIQLNGLSSHHTVTKVQNYEEQVPLRPAKPVTKKWVRGRLVEVLEDE